MGSNTPNKITHNENLSKVQTKQNKKCKQYIHLKCNLHMIS